MDTKDKIQLQRWVAGNASYNQVEAANPHGLVGNVRFGPDAQRAFFLLWTWSAVRISSAAQERFYLKVGSRLYWRRIERAKRWAERVRRGEF